MTSRSITGLVLAALLAVPAAAQAQSKSSSSSGSGIWLGGLFGLESGRESGAQIRFDAEIPISRLTPTLQLAGVGTLSYAWLSHDLGVFEILPSARLNWTGSREFGAYGDIGLGLFHASAHGNDDTGATMRFLGGAWYEMTPTVRFVGEIGLHPHFGNYDDTTFTLMIGAKFRI